MTTIVTNEDCSHTMDFVLVLLCVEYFPTDHEDMTDQERAAHMEKNKPVGGKGVKEYVEPQVRYPSTIHRHVHY
jgi:hypothetical protein